MAKKKIIKKITDSCYEKLASEEEYEALRLKRQKELAEIWAYRDKSEEPLVKAINDIGYSIESIWDFVNTSEPYPDAIPIILKHIVNPEYEFCKARPHCSEAVMMRFDNH